MTEKKEYRPVPGYEGLYSVSSDGAVWSHRRERVLPGTVSRKYVQFILSDGLGGRQHWTGHRLVYSAWLEPLAPNDGKLILHRNDIQWDNRVENLYLGTQLENARDRVANGNDGNARKTHCVNGHEFTEQNTIKVRAGRMCRECKNERKRRYDAQQKESN